ncbi:MAG: LamG-like jellyroll fold domain-containing protein [Bacteroidota bacterium]
MSIADLNGDTQPDIVFNNDDVFAYSFDWSQHQIYPLWQTNTADGSAVTGLTTFDFDSNGSSEVVYRSTNALYILDGVTGAIYDNSTSICPAGTFVDNPIIADINGDGETEICVGCQPYSSPIQNTDNQGYLRLFGAAPGQTWMPSRSVWNQHGYFNVNINDDLTVPRELQDHSVEYGDTLCDGTPGTFRPLNSFLSQSTLLDGSGCPQTDKPDLAFVAGSLTQADFANCITDSLALQFGVTNLGNDALDDTVSVSFYAGNPEDPASQWLGTDTFLLTLSKGEQVTVQTCLDTLPNNTLYVVLNDDGTAAPTPIDYPTSAVVSESNYGNNTDSLVLSESFAISASVSSFNYVCDSTLMNSSGGVQAFVPLGNEEVTAGLTFYWFEGAIASGTADFTGDAVSGLAEGNYTVFAQGNTSGCSSDTVTITVEKRTTDSTLTVRIDEVAPNTSCGNPNGELRAIVKPADVTDSVGDDSGGYSFRWELGTSIGSNSPISTSSIAAGIDGGFPYSVRVTDNLTGCQVEQTLTSTSNAMVYPVVQLDSVSSNTLCVEGNGYARVSVGGDTTGYSFKWFDNEYKPAHDAVGAIRTNLLGGNYFVEVTDINTTCRDTLQVTIEDDLVVPEVNLLSVIDQTSCDTSLPNGQIAITSHAGMPFAYQNPAPLDFFSTVGSASAISATRFQLTPSSAVQSGAIWTNQQVSLAEDFTIDLVLNFGDRDASGADGIAFVLHRDPNGLLALGQDAQTMGAAPLAPGIAIEFDTFNNGFGFGDIPDDHVSVHTTETPSTYGAPLDGPYPMDPAGSNFEDGQDHDVQIAWDADASLITVSIDGEERIHFTYDVRNNIFGGDPWAYLGVTSATGGARNLHQVEIQSIAATTGTRHPQVALEWFDGANTVNPLPTSQLMGDSVAFDLDNGVYRVRATDLVSGCTSEKDIAVEDGRIIPTLNVNRVNMVSNKACDASLANGALEVSSNAVSPTIFQDNTITYSYSWWVGVNAVAAPDFTGQTLAGIPGGNYTLVATDDQTFCSTAEQTFTVLDNIVTDSVTVDLEFCEAYVFGGDTLSTSGTYMKAFPNVLGCDSVVTLNLTLYERGDTSVLDCGPASWVLDLPLDACSGTLAANSVGPNATTVGPRWVEGYTGQGLYFDGRNDYVNVGSDAGLVFTDAFSVAMWVKSTEDGPMVLMTRNRAGSSFSWNIRLEGGVLQAILGGLPTPGPYMGTTDVTDGTWHHVAVTYTTGQVNLYVDGALDASHTVPVGTLGANPSSEVWIGMRADKPNERQYQGHLDNVQAYNELISAEQISEMAAMAEAPEACPTPTSSLVGYWQLDDCNSPIVTNSAGNGFEGIKYGDADQGRGYVNQAAVFDGEGDHIALHDSGYALGTDEGISYSLWVYPTQANGQREVILRRLEDAASIGIFLNQLRPEVYLGGLAGVQYLAADSTLPLNTWSHLGVTYGDGRLRVYRNGEVILSRDNLIGTIHFTPQGQHSLGGNPNGTRSYHGAIDEVRIFNEALGASAMAAELTRVSSSPADCPDLAEGAWLFDDCASSTAVDSLGQHAGILVGATRSAGYLGAGMLFDGVNDYINLGNGAGMELAQAFTISMWMNTTQTTRGTLLIKNPQGGNFSYAVQLDNGNPVLALGNGVSNPGPFRAPVNVADGTWHHLAWTFEQGTVTTYVDGIAEATTHGVMGTVLPNAGSEVWLGWRGDLKPGRAYQGLLDEVRLWTNALSPGKIADLANATPNGTDCTGARAAQTDSSFPTREWFRVYPNPNRGTFTVQVRERSEYTLSVTNMLGQTVYSQSLPADQYEHSVRLAEISPGVYWVAVTSEHGQKLQRLVVE